MFFSTWLIIRRLFMKVKVIRQRASRTIFFKVFTNEKKLLSRQIYCRVNHISFDMANNTSPIHESECN